MKTRVLLVVLILVALVVILLLSAEGVRAPAESALQEGAWVPAGGAVGGLDTAWNAKSAQSGAFGEFERLVG